MTFVAPMNCCNKPSTARLQTPRTVDIHEATGKSVSRGGLSVTVRLATTTVHLFVDSISSQYVCVMSVHVPRHYPQLLKK